MTYMAGRSLLGDALVEARFSHIRIVTRGTWNHQPIQRTLITLYSQTTCILLLYFPLSGRSIPPPGKDQPLPGAPLAEIIWGKVALASWLSMNSNQYYHDLCPERMLKSNLMLTSPTLLHVSGGFNSILPMRFFTISP